MPPKGLRDGELSSQQLAARLTTAFPYAKPYVSTLGKARLYGHALHHGLMDAKEVAMTAPRTESTLACYLRSRVDVGVPEKFEAYVRAWSDLFVRGSWFANLAVAKLAMPKPDDDESPAPCRQVPEVWKRDDLPDGVCAARAFVRDAERLKQCFLPERWPTKKKARDEVVAQVSRDHGALTAHMLPDWRAIMKPTAWGQVTNAMVRQYAGNASVHVRKNIAKAVETYLERLHADGPGELASVVKDAFRRLRPLAVSDDVFRLVADLRAVVGCEGPASYLPREVGDVPYTDDVVALHFFLVRSGVIGDRSFLPVSTVGRKYAYFDERVVRFLMPKEVEAWSKQQRADGCDGDAEGAAVGDDEDGDDGDGGGGAGDPGDVSTFLQRFLGLTPSSFRWSSREARRLRRRGCRRMRDEGARRKALRRGKGRGMTPSQRLLAGRGASAADDAVTVSSFRTDGVGLRVCVKVPVDVSRHVRAMPTPVEVAALESVAATADRARATGWRRKASPDHPDPGVAAAAVERDAASVAVERAKAEVAAAAKGSEEAKAARARARDANAALAAAKRALGEALDAFQAAARARFAPPPPPTVDPSDPPVFVGMDTGRAKPFAAAVGTSPIVKPTTVVFTRRRHHHEMGHFAFRRWERRRLAARPEVSTALQALAESGGTKNASVVKWTGYLGAHAAHAGVLKDEYLAVERAVWKMRLFRRKRSSLDRAVQRIFDLAHGRKTLVVGVGNAKFAATGRGEMAAPTTSLHAALRRAIARRTGRTEVLDVWEHRTTLCCCACGAETAPAPVVDPRTGNIRGSRRLRLCASCHPTAPKLRDRDVQAARNILWLTIAQYVGAERPTYMCCERARTQAAQAA